MVELVIYVDLDLRIDMEGMEEVIGVNFVDDYNRNVGYNFLFVYCGGKVYVGK